jgi:hypothetical protein
LYTLTPPVFDRASRSDGAVLVRTPLECWAEPRRRLFNNHFTTGGEGDYLFDARIHMAPPPLPGAARNSQDFMARIYLPQPSRAGAAGAGGSVRPLADAQFHLQHPEDAHTFTDVVLRTEGGGTAYAQGAINLTTAWNRTGAQSQTKSAPSAPLATSTSVTASTNTAAGESAKDKDAAYVRSLQQGPRGISTFFNLPLFGRGHPSVAVEVVEGVAEGAGAGAAAPSSAFRQKPLLRDSPTWGLRFDDATFSAGVHLDPQWTLRSLRDQGAATTARNLKVGGWISQESDNVRFSAEGTVAPLQSGTAAAAAVGNHPEGHPIVAPGVVPVSLSSRLPLLLQSRVGLFYRDVRASVSTTSMAAPSSARNSTRPNYEVGFTLSNATNHGSSGAKGSGALRTSQELVASYVHHLTVRRNIHNPLEHKHNRSIHNYVDLSMEVAYRNDFVHGGAPSAAPASSSSSSSAGSSAASHAAHAAAAAAAALSPPSIRLGVSWQLNKNSLVKLRMQDDSISALYALKRSVGTLSTRHTQNTPVGCNRRFSRIV